MRRCCESWRGTASYARWPVIAAVVLGGVPPVGYGQVGQLSLDTVQAGRFDYGKMWTFEYPPAQYFTTTYGFDADSAWFERARLSAVRIPGCSASFVSPHGLLATNHHCVRGSVARVTQPGETLLDSGFYGASLAAERPGSPAVTPELALVGLNFDRNIEGLTRDFIYLPERGRNIMVDVRAVRAALDQVYSTDRILAEIETGRLFATEGEAETVRH
jgi:hypothetical protein